MWFLLASYLGTKITTEDGIKQVSGPNDIAAMAGVPRKISVSG